MKNLDNVETKKLIPIIKAFLEKVDINFETIETISEEFEWKSRDGFSAHDHNRGGMDLIAITNNSYLKGSGTHIGTSIETYVEGSYNDSLVSIKEEFPELAEDSNEFYEKIDEMESDEYSGQAFRIRVMYEGNNIMRVYAGWDHDAPYYRWSNKPEFEKTIKFKNKRDLKTKLNKLLKKIGDLN